jgi:hypothetical protein
VDFDRDRDLAIDAPLTASIAVDHADLCSSADVGCRPAADVHDGAAAVRVKTNARRRFVPHGPLLAIVAGELPANGPGFEHDGRHDSHVVRALSSAVPLLAIAGGHAVGDGCAFADVRCEPPPRLSSPSAVLRERVHDGCMSAEDGRDSTDDGCSLAADGRDGAAAVSDGAAAVRVETDACRAFVHHGRPFAIVDRELSAYGHELQGDG